MSHASESYSKYHASMAGLSLKTLGLRSWSEADVAEFQAQISPSLDADGWFGPESIAALAARKPEVIVTPEFTAGHLILNGKSVAPPEGVKVVNYAEKGGLRASTRALSPRTATVTQLLLHRGSQAVVDGARHTLNVLEAKKPNACSTTFIIALDGVIYQTFDPAKYAGRHCIHHNHQSDAIDLVGPVQMKTSTGQELKGVRGQEIWPLPLAIGREGDNLPPYARKVVTTRQWSPTPAQQEALARFVPWWCSIRGIPRVACADPRTFRLGGLGPKDPITNQRGIFGHIQVAGPGTRVDGAVEIESLLRASKAGLIPPQLQIEWIDSWAKVKD